MYRYINRIRRQYLLKSTATTQRQRRRQDLRAAGVVLVAALLYLAIAAHFAGTKITVVVEVADSGCTYMSEGEE